MTTLPIIRFIFFIFCISLTTSVYAEHIDNFEVNITVEPSGEFLVSESIEYDFDKEYKHGIHREIPIKAYTNGNVNGVKWGAYFDIGLKDFNVQMDSKPVVWTKELIKSLGQDMVMLKIGSKDNIVSGKRKYTITYRCSNAIMPSSFHKDKDILYWNAVGNGWKVHILQTKVNIFLPLKLHKNNVSVIYPKKYIWKDEHYIHIETNQNSTSFKIAFPRGFLLQDTKLKIAHAEQNLRQISEKKQKQKQASIDARDKAKQEKYLQLEHRRELGIKSWILFFILLDIVWFKRDALGLKRDTRSVVMRYNVPRNFSVLQSGLIMDKNLDREDIYAALMELSYLGYIKIEESDDNVILKRIAKERGKLSDDQWELLEAFFKESNSFVPKDATVSETEKLLKNISNIYNNLYIWAKKQGYTVGNLNKTREKGFMKIFTVLLPLLVLSIVIAMNTDYTGEEISYILFCIFSILLPWFIVSYITVSFKMQISSLVFGIVLWIELMRKDIFPVQRGMSLEDVLGSYIAVMVFLAIFSFVFVWKIGRYTTKGKDAVRELKGFEIFIGSAKEDEIRRRLKEEPNYVDKMLPYAMLFSQVKHWLEMYDILNIPHLEKTQYTALDSLKRNDMLKRKSIITINMGSSGTSTQSSSSSSYSTGAGGGGGGSW